MGLFNLPASSPSLVNYGPQLEGRDHAAQFYPVHCCAFVISVFPGSGTGTRKSLEDVALINVSSGERQLHPLSDVPPTAL